eukprot:2957378-Amphidinium_carterae.1
MVSGVKVAAFVCYQRGCSDDSRLRFMLDPWPLNRRGSAAHVTPWVMHCVELRGRNFCCHGHTHSPMYMYLMRRKSRVSSPDRLWPKLAAASFENPHGEQRQCQLKARG